MKLAFIYGTRPEIIKLSPIIQLCIKERIGFFTIHTGQHYSYHMFKLFLDELKLPKPDYTLNIKSKAPYRQGDHTGRMMVKLEEILLKEMPQVVLVQGDTNTTLAGALTTSKISTTKSFTNFNIKLAHVEAGLRSYDRNMPEELNRIIADHLADYLFVPTKRAKKITIKEGVPRKKVFLTGNTIVDAVKYCLDQSDKNEYILEKYNLEKNGYILLTLHRQENVDDKKRLIKILGGIERICKEYKMPVIFPIHPRTVKMFELFNIKTHPLIKTIEPCSFLGFLALEVSSRLIFTDSGGVQEEACMLKVPCVTLRESTERPETIEVGANIIAGIEPKMIASSAEVMLKRKRSWKNPLGNGDTARKIISILRKGA